MVKMPGTGVPSRTGIAPTPPAGYAATSDAGNDPAWWDGDSGTETEILGDTTLDVTAAMWPDGRFADGVRITGRSIYGGGESLDVTVVMTDGTTHAGTVSFSSTNETIEITFSSGVIARYEVSPSTGNGLHVQDTEPHLTDEHDHDL